MKIPLDNKLLWALAAAAFLLQRCGWVMKAGGYPPEAMRKPPLPGLDEVAWPATWVVDQGGVIRCAAVSQTYPVRPSVEALLAAIESANSPKSAKSGDAVKATP